MVLNQFIAPGLGSLLAKRFIAGIGQLLLALAGCAMVMVWLLQLLVKEYRLTNDLPVDEQTHGWIMKTGFILFGISWLWAGITTISVMREAKRTAEQNLKAPPRLN